ncbi:hypothetical protein Tco_0877780 [Tanacetum coccineum]|uniref:Uncharacterized protein n=1 Tax=Tanacetum coccineum TaxID=301880 RepID=A0ABQ5C1U6_9ASTR
MVLPCQRWEARHQVSGLMGITKLTRWSWLSICLIRLKHHTPINIAAHHERFLGKTVNVKGKQPHKPEEEKDFHSNEVRLLKELLKEKTKQVQQMIKDQAKEYYENKAIMQRKEELWQSEKSLLIKDLTDSLKIIDQLKIVQIKFKEQKDEEIRKLKAQLQEEKDKEREVQYSNCLNEARILEEEPLNKAKRSNKPRRSKQKSWERWSTLGEPSGKNGGKILVLQEQFSQNQQDFLDEYLPQWDDQLAIQKHKSEMEWENPFAAKRSENHTLLHLSKNEEKDDDLPYPKFRKFKQLAAQIINKHEEHAFPIAAYDAESSISYQPLPDAIIGPALYPLGKGTTFYEGYGEYHNSQWTLPLAWMESGVMLVLPTDPGLWSVVISRWESITINRLNSQTWSDNKAKLAFVENLLGESENLMWQQWRTAYPRAYSALETIADGPQNITS